MTADKLQQEFEAAYIEEMVSLSGEAIRGAAQAAIDHQMPNGEYAEPMLRLGLWAWQVSRAAQESAYAAIIEDLGRARIAGFDGYDFSGLKDRRSDQKVFEISIETELDCSLEDGEYTVRITNLLGCWLGTDDFVMIEDAVSEVIGDLILPREGHTTFIAYESGERQDVFWTKWFEIVPVSAVVKP